MTRRCSGNRRHGFGRFSKLPFPLILSSQSTLSTHYICKEHDSSYTICFRVASEVRLVAYPTCPEAAVDLSVSVAKSNSRSAPDWRVLMLSNDPSDTEGAASCGHRKWPWKFQAFSQTQPRVTAWHNSVADFVLHFQLCNWYGGCCPSSHFSATHLQSSYNFPPHSRTLVEREDLKSGQIWTHREFGAIWYRQPVVKVDNFHLYFHEKDRIFCFSSD